MHDEPIAPDTLLCAPLGFRRSMEQYRVECWSLESASPLIGAKALSVRSTVSRAALRADTTLAAAPRELPAVALGAQPDDANAPDAAPPANMQFGVSTGLFPDPTLRVRYGDKWLNTFACPASLSLDDEGLRVPFEIALRASADAALAD